MAWKVNTSQECPKWSITLKVHNFGISFAPLIFLFRIIRSYIKMKQNIIIATYYYLLHSLLFFNYLLLFHVFVVFCIRPSCTSGLSIFLLCIYSYLEVILIFISKAKRSIINKLCGIWILNFMGSGIISKPFTLYGPEF